MSNFASAVTEQEANKVVVPSSPPKGLARGGGYGLDAELNRKREQKYDTSLEEQAKSWMEAILNSPFPGSFADSLKDGIILCSLINAIKPDTIRKIETSKNPFKQMSNISYFLKACRTLGVREFDLFETVDLYEEKDMGVVVNCIHALGRAVQNFYDGPRLGVNESAKNIRRFTKEQLSAGANQMTKIAMGSYGKMEREVIKDTGITFGAKMGQLSG